MLALYESGVLRLDELITSTYRLDEISQGYEDMYSGKNIRGSSFTSTERCMPRRAAVRSS